MPESFLPISYSLRTSGIWGQTWEVVTVDLQGEECTKNQSARPTLNQTFSKPPPLGGTVISCSFISIGSASVCGPIYDMCDVSATSWWKCRLGAQMTLIYLLDIQSPADPKRSGITKPQNAWLGFKKMILYIKHIFMVSWFCGTCGYLVMNRVTISLSLYCEIYVTVLAPYWTPSSHITCLHGHISRMHGLNCLIGDRGVSTIRSFSIGQPPTGVQGSRITKPPELVIC